jgi:hypothetical protein
MGTKHPASPRMPQRSAQVAGVQPKPATRKMKLDGKVDRQSEESFPASDPPSYAGGKHIIGAPRNRESGAAKASSGAVRAAEHRAKTGASKQPDRY